MKSLVKMMSSAILAGAVMAGGGLAIQRAIVARAGEGERPLNTAITDIGSRRELFVDGLLIDRFSGASLKLHQPQPGGTALKADRPWEGPANFGIAVLRHGDRLLMYYRGMTLGKDDNGVLCVATSQDGTTWTKPALGLVERAGRRDTNIVADEARRAFTATPWLDTRPGVPAGERIKVVLSEPLSGEKHTPFQDPAGPKRLVLLVSADGFTFRRLEPQPEMVSDLPNCFDGGNTMFWSEAEQQYVLYYRWCDVYPGKGKSKDWKLPHRRTMARATSKDLLRWSKSVPMTYGDTPREQFYVNNTQPYFRAPQVYAALAARFVEGRQAVTEQQAAAIGLKSVGPHRYNNDCSDGVLLTSRSGSTRYDRTFMESFVRPGPGAQNWVSRANYPLTGVLPCGEDRMMFWVSRHYMQDTWHIERLLLRLDGFASVNAPYAGGEMVTRPLTFAGQQLEINYATGAAGSVRIEVQDAAGRPLPGFALADCPEIIGDEIAGAVAWKGGDLAPLAGRAVRLRFVLKDADLYSLRFF